MAYNIIALQRVQPSPFTDGTPNTRHAYMYVSNVFASKTKKLCSIRAYSWRSKASSNLVYVFLMPRKTNNTNLRSPPRTAQEHSVELLQ